jgi:hypothetical protein
MSVAPRAGTRRRPAWLAQLEPDGTVLRASLRRYGSALVLLGVFDAISVALLLGNTVARAVGLLGLAFFGVYTAVVVVRGAFRMPLYGIDRHGLHLPRLGLLPWTAISTLRWERYRGEPWLGVVPYDPGRLRRLGHLRWLARLNAAFGFAPFQLDPRQVGLEPTELHALLERYLPGVRVEGPAAG